MKHALEQKVEFKQAEEMVDAAGNVTKGMFPMQPD